MTPPRTPLYTLVIECALEVTPGRVPPGFISVSLVVLHTLEIFTHPRLPFASLPSRLAFVVQAGSGLLDIPDVHQPLILSGL